MGGDPAQRVVRHVLAEGEVEVLQAGQVPVEGRVQGGVGQVVAAGHVEALKVGDPVDQLPEALPQAEHLHLADAPAHQGGKEGGVWPSKVQLGLTAFPHRFQVGRVPPTRTHLKQKQV